MVNGNPVIGLRFSIKLIFKVNCLAENRADRNSTPDIKNMMYEKMRKTFLINGQYGITDEHLVSSIQSKLILVIKT